MVAWAIAKNTFKEAVRSKILYSLIFFALVMMGVSLVLDQVTVGQRSKIIMDFGLASINLFGILIAIVVGIGLVYKEIEKRTIYPLLAKPVRRSEFLIGKYFGIVLTLGVEVVLMSFFLFLLMAIYGLSTDSRMFDLGLLAAIFLIFLEMAVIAAVAILFSSFSTPFLSGMFTLAVYVIGHLTEDLKRLGALSGSPALEKMTAFLYYLLPNLENFNIKGEVVYQLPVETGRILLGLLYGLLYIGLLIFFSSMLFQRRDFR
ncbi:MAG: ABC transporter permease [Candidatus Manganitrophus sp.]|jgi:ABC-type transport system involved in multi-copper enzyme maturation permease subunit|nr:ABC transporter permease [Candidatus Manganitrophus morganii]MDC4204201.1 ABC transporter permease [Candidatus Manganitrophus sp.]WDT71509.1 MAG: ABC transporter permease [Candidatus Manganitrophus sp.]WDT81147.1 MAG: ABC transporter permease [Candidatus Manganitrophus sp.]